MAYMTQEKKKALAPEIKRILTKHGLKGTLSVQNYSTLVLTISEGDIDFIRNRNENANERYSWQLHDDYVDVNHYHVRSTFSGVAADALQELVEAMNAGNHDNSNPMIDYYDIGWYISIRVGTYQKPYRYQLVA